jgi:hypothetical protein
MAVPTKDAVIPDDAPDHLLLAKHIDFIANYGKVGKTNSSVFLVNSICILNYTRDMGGLLAKRLD